MDRSTPYNQFLQLLSTKQDMDRELQRISAREDYVQRVRLFLAQQEPAQVQRDYARLYQEVVQESEVIQQQLIHVARQKVQWQQSMHEVMRQLDDIVLGVLPSAGASTDPTMAEITAALSRVNFREDGFRH
jgi:hypothetical protein